MTLLTRSIIVSFIVDLHRLSFEVCLLLGLVVLTWAVIVSFHGLLVEIGITGVQCYGKVYRVRSYRGCVADATPPESLYPERQRKFPT